MDHSNAHLIEFSSEVKKTKTSSSDFTFQDRNETLHRSEIEMHNKEQHKHTTFYKKMTDFEQHHFVKDYFNRFEIK